MNNLPEALGILDSCARMTSELLQLKDEFVKKEQMDILLINQTFKK